MTETEVWLRRDGSLWLYGYIDDHYAKVRMWGVYNGSSFYVLFDRSDFESLEVL